MFRTLFIKQTANKCDVTIVYVEIEDGRNGAFDLKPYLDHGVFRELRDVHYFNRVGILFGAVTWPHEQDIAPETLLAEMVPLDSNLAPNKGIVTGASNLA